MLLAGTVLGILGFTLYLFSTGQGAPSVEVISMAVDGLLTLALIALYASILGIQKKQANLAEIERTPLIEIAGYELDGDDITVYLSNYGNGTATNLELVTVSHFETDHELLEPGAAPEPLRREVNEVNHNYEQSIRPHDKRVEFKASPGLVAHRDQERGGFSFAIRQLQSDRVENVAFQLYVRYSTRTGKRYTIPLFRMPREIDVDEDATFNDAYTIETGVTSVPYTIPDPEYPLPPHLSEDAGHPPRQEEIDF